MDRRRLLQIGLALFGGGVVAGTLSYGVLVPPDMRKEFEAQVIGNFKDPGDVPEGKLLWDGHAHFADYTGTDFQIFVETLLDSRVDIQTISGREGREGYLNYKTFRERCQGLEGIETLIQDRNGMILRKGDSQVAVYESHEFERPVDGSSHEMHIVIPRSYGIEGKTANEILDVAKSKRRKIQIAHPFVIPTDATILGIPWFFRYPTESEIITLEHFCLMYNLVLETGNHTATWWMDFANVYAERLANDRVVAGVHVTDAHPTDDWEMLERMVGCYGTLIPGKVSNLEGLFGREIIDFVYNLAPEGERFGYPMSSKVFKEVMT